MSGEGESGYSEGLGALLLGAREESLQELSQKPGFFWQTAQISQAALTRNPVSRNTESVF